MTECTVPQCPCWKECGRTYEGARCALWDEHRQEVTDAMRALNRRMLDELRRRQVVRRIDEYMAQQRKETPNA